MASGLQSAGYAALPDLMAAMRAGPNRRPFVMQADVENSDNATAQTVEQMCILIKESIADPLTQLVADFAVVTWSHGSTDPRAVAWACWWFAKHSIKFVLDGPAAQNFVGLSEALEFLVSPAVMLRCRKMQGDCDDFTMMICALLGCYGIGYEIITAAANPREPGTFSHVYCRAVLPDGSRVPLDASHGKYPGWQVPSAHVSRLQAWDEDGNPVPDQGSNNWDGLHGYTAARGLGQTEDDDDNTPDDISGLLNTSGPTTGANATLSFLEPLNTGDISSSGGVTTCIASSPSDCPAGTQFIQGSALPAALSGGTCGAGLTLYNGSCVNPSTLNPAQQIASSISQLFAPGSPLAKAILPNQQAGTININTSSLLLYAGIAVAALVVFSVVSKK
jgi:hypothetical protein